jgi:hypothetical protein
MKDLSALKMPVSSQERRKVTEAMEATNAAIFHFFAPLIPKEKLFTLFGLKK